jgi:NAD(P)H dehydrogenase (quinone)
LGYELAATIAEVTGTPCTYKALEPGELMEGMKAAGLDEGVAGFVAALDQNIAEGGLAEATEDLGTLIERPTTPLKETVKKMLD